MIVSAFHFIDRSLNKYYFIYFNFFQTEIERLIVGVGMYFVFVLVFKIYIFHGLYLEVHSITFLFINFFGK